MPANVSVSVRAIVTAGLAKLVDDVNQYARRDVPADRERRGIAVRPERTTPKITSSSPNVATTSPNHSAADARRASTGSTAGRSNITFAR